MTATSHLKANRTSRCTSLLLILNCSSHFVALFLLLVQDPRDKWTGSEMDIERGIVYSDVKRLNIAGFAGLYAMTYFGSEGIRTIESNCLQADRAYVEITKIGTRACALASCMCRVCVRACVTCMCVHAC
jgi:hypothetical protein